MLEALGRGDRIGHLVLERRIGAGGMGVVWAALDEARGELVAAKILRHLEGPGARRQRREARIAMTLLHPNIVPVREVIDAPDLGPVLVMPLLVGESLEAVLGREPRLSPARVAELVLPVLEAVGHAHAGGIVHRDLKPANVFVEASGAVRVLDFGFAKLLADAITGASEATPPGELLGTPRYMAPEQVFGESDVDARVDVWAAGVLVYRALTGEMPVAGRTVGEIIKSFARGGVVPIAARGVPIPSAVEGAVTRALERDRRRRALDVAELHSALRGCLAAPR